MKIVFRDNFEKDTKEKENPETTNLKEYEAILNAFNAKMPVAAAHLLEFPLPGKKKVFRNQRFPLDNVGR